MENTQVPFGYTKDGKIYLNAWSSFPEREIGEVRDDDIEKSVTFFIERYNDLKRKVDEVVQKIESNENKGSFLMKVLHLKDQLPKHDGLGDYQILFEILARYESLVKDIIQKNRSRNTEIKTALIEETKVAVESINWKEGTEKMNDLKTRWIKTGNAEEDKQEALEEVFWGLVKDFFDRKKNFFEDKQKLIELRQKKYEELVTEAEKVNNLHGKARFDEIKKLREAWKNVGGVPSEIFKPLIGQFNEHLKTKKDTPRTDYAKIISTLQDLKLSKEPINRQELEVIKKNALSDRSRNPDKKKVLEWIQLLTERDFVNSLAQKRFKDFAKLAADKKKSIREGIIKDLISRDKEDLKTYEENSANFSSTDGKFHKMVEGKLKTQKRKIQTKETLLEWLNNNEF